MALPKTDAFDPLTSDKRIGVYDANWKENNSSQWSVILASTDVKVIAQGTSGENACHWEGDVFEDNQYAQVRFSSVVALNGQGAAVRVASGTTGTYYCFYASNADHFLGKNNESTWTQIGDTDTTNGATNEICRLEVSGTTLTPKINGAVWAQGAKTDESIGSGYAGMSGWGQDVSARVDDFEGGNLEDEECNTIVVMEVNVAQAPVITTTTVVMGS